MTDNSKDYMRRFWPKVVALLMIVCGIYLAEFAIIWTTIPIGDHPHRAIAFGITGLLNGIVIAVGAMVVAGNLRITRR